MKIMQRLGVFACLILAMFVVSKFAVQAAIENEHDYMLLNHSSFTVDNQWITDTNTAGYSGKVMRAGGIGAKSSAYILPSKTATYKVWVRTVDFKTDPGTRSFWVKCNTGYLEKEAGSFDNVDWSSQPDGASLWQWECIGEVYLTQNEVNKISIIANNAFSRMDCIMLTDNASYTPPAEASSVVELNKHLQNNADLTYDENRFGNYSYALNLNSASTIGSWSVRGAVVDSALLDTRWCFFGQFLEGWNGQSETKYVPARFDPYIFEAGNYTIWVRTNTPANHGNYMRTFKLNVNGVDSVELGHHPEKIGYAWENAGSFTLKEGNNAIKLIETNSTFARMNCIYITKDATCEPSNNESLFIANATYLNMTCGEQGTSNYPEYVQTENAIVQSTVQISNENITVDFYNVTNDGTAFVQNAVTYKGDLLKKREEPFLRQLYRAGNAEHTTSYTRGSPNLKVTAIPAMQTAVNDNANDNAWGITNDKIWTNTVFQEDGSIANRATDVKGETVTVKLYIPKSGTYYGVSRGYYSPNDSSYERGYTVSVDGQYLLTNNQTHYFNAYNMSGTEGYQFSYNTTPIQLSEGEVIVTLQSFDNKPMRTSFFALIPAADTSALQTEISALTSFDVAVKRLGGNVLETTGFQTVPRTDTGYPHPITYDYVQTVAEANLTGVTDDTYSMGIGEWLVPKTATQTADNKVTLSYDNKYVAVTEVWELQPGDEEPRVTLTFTAKKQGTYYVAVPTHNSYSETEYEYLLAPMQYRGHQFPEKALLVTEQFLFTPIVTVSLPENNNVVNGKKVTFGYTMEPSSIENRWVYQKDYNFAATMRSSIADEKYDIKPVLIGSAPGGINDRYNIGESYTMQFRPIYRTGDWYDTFSHVAEDLYGVRDYRTNYYNSVTDAILNTSNLIMDDFYSGWDQNHMGFWNFEGRSFITQSTPLEMIQRYMLTDDTTFLKERTIPSIISAITKPQHFKASPFDSEADLDLSTTEFMKKYGGMHIYLPASKYTDLPSTMFSEVGANKMFGASVLTGIYKMSQGSFGYLEDTAIALADEIPENSNSGSAISDLVAVYQHTGNTKYLEKAKKVADNYILALQTETNSTAPIAFGYFAYISYMPFLSGLIDIYEVTGEQKYLDAAEYAGQVVQTLVWNVGMDGDRANESMLLDSKSVGAIDFISADTYWWHGDVRWRPGMAVVDGVPQGDPYVQDFSKVPSETVPAWVPSRVGIGLEQPSTFYGDSLNIIMSNWAGDMMRLAEYTGDKSYEASARNAIIGRFGTYSGYYINRFATLQMKDGYQQNSPVNITQVYWHHIPPFLSMLEDFLITQAWSWSNRNVEFPSIRQQGYAYFNNKQYGFASGKFFGENDMWLWIDDGVVSPVNINVDWVAARKDGVMGIALMNELDTASPFTIVLGEESDATYTGPVYLYNPDGSFVVTTANNGEFVANIPAKSMVGALIYSNKIKAPSFANTKYNVAENTANVQTVAEHTDVTGAGTILQFSPDRYYVHIYIENKPVNTENALDATGVKVYYKIGDGETVVVEDNEYPFEVIVEVSGADQINQPFTYAVHTINKDGTTTVSNHYTLTPMTCTVEDVQQNTGTILLTGRNFADALGYDRNGDFWTQDNTILSDYGLYNNHFSIAEAPTIEIEVPADGVYYIYGNMRAGVSNYPETRAVTMQITQNGETQTVSERDGSVYKFGYSADVAEKLDSIANDQFWNNGLGVMAPIPVRLTKGLAEITVEFEEWGGFDFLLLTNDMQVRRQLDAQRVYTGYNIFKFWNDNTELKAMLNGYVDVTPSYAPSLSADNDRFTDEFVIHVSETVGNDNLYYLIYKNDVQVRRITSTELIASNHVLKFTEFKSGDVFYAVGIDDHGNRAYSQSLVVSSDKLSAIRPEKYANVDKHVAYASVDDAKNANALPNSYFAFMTQENFERKTEGVVWKQDDDLFEVGSEKTSYYSDSANQFVKSYTGTFTIPESDETTYYQFISSYLYLTNSDFRRTHFILVDGKAVSEQGLVEWNGGIDYFTTMCNTNSYVFGSEHGRSADVYPFKDTDAHGHFWGYSPAIALEPGIHTVEVYTVGQTSWFNNLIITDDIGYDVSKLLYAGLTTRDSNDWANNFNNVIKPQYTDFDAPVLPGDITAVSENGMTKLSWSAATDTGIGNYGPNIIYKVELTNASGTTTHYTRDTHFTVLPENANDVNYTATVTAVDAVGNTSDVLNISFVVQLPEQAVCFILAKNKSYILLNTHKNTSLTGDVRIFIAGSSDSSSLESIVSYPAIITQNQINYVTVDTPQFENGVTYWVYVWQNNTLKPLCAPVIANP